MKTLLLKITTITSIVLVLLMSNACTKNFQEKNTYPGLVTSDVVDPNLLLTRVEVYLFERNYNSGAYSSGNYCGMDVSDANRPFQTGDKPALWNDTYENYVRNTSDIMRLTEKDPAMVNKHAIARIIKAYAFARLTDVYGDVPYFQSSLSLENAKYQPAYDQQKDIYADLFSELKGAVAELDASKDSYGSADILYGGNVGSWKKFANSIRLRLALRVRYADANLASQQMADLTLDNLISTRDDDASIMTIMDYPENENGSYVSLINADGDLTKGYIGKTLLDILNDNNDPRTRLYADTAKATFPGSIDTLDYFHFRGHPLLGLVPVEEKYPYGSESCSRVPDFAYVPKVERVVYGSAETYFSLAEAALAGLYGSPGDAQTYYKQGIQQAEAWAMDMFNNAVPQMSEVCLLLHKRDKDASGNPAPWTDANVQDYINYKTVTQAEVDDFLANSPAVTLTGDNDHKLEQIINQKIVAMYPNYIEGWSEKRRTGYPRILIGDDNDDLKGTIPRRYPWPTSEEQVNSANFAAALERFGGVDDETVRIWWDANPDYLKPYPGKVLKMNQAWITAK